MGYAKRMKVVDASSNLAGYLPRSILRYLEVLGLQVREEVTSFEVLHDDINVIGIFENIKKSYNIWVLAYFENLDLPLE